MAYQAPLSMGFSKQECWSGLPFPSPGDLPDPGIEPRSPALQAGALPSELPGKPWNTQKNYTKKDPHDPDNHDGVLTHLEPDWGLKSLLMKVKAKLLSRVQLFGTPWTVACQAPPSMRFSRQECWSGLPFPSPGDLPNPGIKPRSPHCRQTLYHLSHQGSPG